MRPGPATFTWRHRVLQLHCVCLVLRAFQTNVAPPHSYHRQVGYVVSAVYGICCVWYLLCMVSAAYGI
eukprot:gene10988-biopygen7809